jgi:Arc/MetJ-type ribon-helix-helix transcriptional regulator
MTIEIPADRQPFVREQLELGCFPNEQQLITEALQLLKAERDQSIEGIKLGLADAAAGRVQPLAEAFADLRRELNLPEDCLNHCPPA